MRYKSYIVFLLSYLMLLCCSKERNINYLKFDQNGLCVLSEWLMVGPFRYDTASQKPWETFANRDLDYFEINEDSFNIDDLEKLQGKRIRNKYILKKFATHNLKSYTDTIVNKSNFYLATILDSDKEQDMVLLGDGASSIKVWLNQQLIYQTKSHFNILKIADRFVPVHLKKGKNIFLVKVNREGNIYSWGFYLALSNKEVASEIFHFNHINDFVLNPIILDTLVFYGGSLTIRKAEIYSQDTILNYEVQEVGKNNYRISGLETLPSRFYDFRVITNNDTLSQKIFKGDILAFYEKLKTGYLKNPGKTHSGESVIERIDFLRQKAVFFPPLTTNGYYNENNIVQSNTSLVDWVERLYSIVENDGLMLKTYVSPTDSSINHFILYIDKKLKTKPDVPLVVIMPYAINEPKFTTSWYIWILDQILADSVLASERGFAICWLYARCSNYTLLSSVEDFNYALAQIKSEFRNINTDKIYITGDCLGATRALCVAYSLPNRIKAISLKSPIPKMEYYSEGIKNIADIPILIQHGIYDSDIPLKDMRSFFESFSKDMKLSTYKEVEEGHASFRRDNRRFTFDYFFEIYKTGW